MSLGYIWSATYNGTLSAASTGLLYRIVLTHAEGTKSGKDGQAFIVEPYIGPGIVKGAW